MVKNSFIILLIFFLFFSCSQNLEHAFDDESDYQHAAPGVPIPSGSGDHLGSAVDVTAPLVSGNLTFGAITDTSIEIQWPSVTDDTSPSSELFYKVVMADSEADIDTVTEVGAISGGLYLISEYRQNLTSVTAKHLTATTTYWFNVLVKDKAGNTAIFHPAVVSTRTVDNDSPYAGSAISFSTVGPDAVTLNWGLAFDDISPTDKVTYKVVKSLSSANIDTVEEANAIPPGENLIVDYTANISSAVVGSLSADTTYWFTVVARDEAGNMVVYNPVSQKTPAAIDSVAPTAGSGGAITFSNITDTSLQLSWAKATDTITDQSNLQYRVVVSQNSTEIDSIAEVTAINSGGQLVKDFTMDLEQAVVGSLSAATTYHFAVMVKDQAGNAALYGPHSQAMAAAPSETSNLTAISSGFISMDGTYLPDSIITGGLKNKRIAMSGGHGYKKSSTYNWILQRWWHYNGVVQGSSPHDRSFVEDFLNNDLMYYFQQYISNAGAYTLIERETSRQHNGVVVTVADSGFNSNGNTSSSTASGVFSGRFGKPSYGYQFMYGDSIGSKTFEFVFNVPEDGEYPVYYHWRSSYNRADNIPVTIVHAGGATHTFMHQKTRGPAEGTTDYHGTGYNRYQMIHLGNYYFKSGTQGKLIVYSSVGADEVIIADAVRIGTGLSPVENNSTTTGQELNESDALSFQEYLNRPATVLTNDVTTRPHAANYEVADAFISIHNNAGGSHGTMIIWENQGQNYNNLSGLPLQSKNLAHAVEDKMVGLIRDRYDSSWQDIYWGDEGFDGDYGETRVADIPAVLIEIGFFDHSGDWWALADEKFHKLATMGMYHGVADFFGTGYAPEPVTHLRAVNNAAGCDFHVAWQPAANGSVATHYIVRRSVDGYAYDSGSYTTDTFACYNNVAANTTYFFKVIAVNANGISLPSETAGVHRQATAEKSILIVNGFDREDARVNNLKRYIRSSAPPVEKSGNDFNYIIQHGNAVVDSGKTWYFDYASNEAVINGNVSLSGYDAVDWYVGRESTGDDTFTEAEQALIQTYLNNGGSLLVSGSEIGWELAYSNTSPSAQDQAFYTGYLKGTLWPNSSYDDAGTNNIVAATTASVFSGLSPFSLDDGSSGVYKNYFADILAPQGGAVKELQYSGGSFDGSASVLSYSGSYKLVHFGFPFEIINGPAARAAVMGKILDFF